MLTQVHPRSDVYFKRFRMEIDLADAPAVPELPAGYAWVPWRETLLACHAEIKYLSFHAEIDAQVFPNLGDRIGCLNLMEEIARRSSFCPEATWLVRCDDGFCGTIQGVSDRAGIGAIQNLGVLPLYRSQGLGVALLLKALEGFRSARMKRVFLEVTAQNEGALRMYHRLGFRRRKTLYKGVNRAGLERAEPARANNVSGSLVSGESWTVDGES
jgi:ribosomal protein S18 acetylase RimI-like enzyme